MAGIYFFFLLARVLLRLEVLESQDYVSMNMYLSHLFCLRPLKFCLRSVDSKSDSYTAILPHQYLLTFGVILKVLGQRAQQNTISFDGQSDGEESVARG